LGAASDIQASCDPYFSLQAIAESSLLGLKLMKPGKKVSVMIVGNHSAGKSSFINWYTGDSTQKTGVAIETRGFTFVTGVSTCPAPHRHSRITLQCAWLTLLCTSLPPLPIAGKKRDTLTGEATLRYYDHLQVVP
jgi:hypothetical protein